MKKQRGITLISLVITIIILLILASVGTYAGVNVIQSAKMTAFTTELKIMQTQVNAIYEERDETKIYGEEILGNRKERADFVFTLEESEITSQEGYRYWSIETIKSLGIEGVEQSFFVNLEKRSVVSYEGFQYEGKTYYTLAQLPNGLYNIEYQPNTGKPTFSINTEPISTDKWRITISNIQYDGYINKWRVRYRAEDKSDWTTTEDMSFVVNTKGFYYIAIENEETKSEEQITCILDKENVKITKDIEGTLPANTQIKDTNTYLNFDMGNSSEYTITTEPALPLKITENGEYSFLINITDKEGKTGTVKHKVIVDSYVLEPDFWIDFAGTSYIELNNVDQNDLYQEYTIATKVNLNQAKQTSKNYMGLYGKHLGKEGIQLQFLQQTTSLRNVDYGPYYDKWTDIVCTYKKTDQLVKTYFNGQLGSEINSVDTLPYEGFTIGTSYLPQDRRMFGKMTCLKIWNKELTAQEVAEIDLFKEDVEVRKENIYANINLKSEEEVRKIGTFVGTGHTFK